MSTDPVLERLRALDPAAPIPTDESARIRRTAMLERILATPQAAPQTAPPPRRPRYAGRIVLVGAAAAVAVGAVVVAHAAAPGSGSGFTAAQLASWVPVPRSAALSAEAERWCADATASQSSAAPAFSNGDQRGAIASMVVTRGGSRDLCLTTGGSEGTWELLDGPGMRLPVVAARGVNLQSAGSQGDPATSVSTAWGQIGADVTGVTIVVNGREITATVGGGIWSAWWPGVDAYAPSKAVVTYRDGSTATVPLLTP